MKWIGLAALAWLAACAPAQREAAKAGRESACTAAARSTWQGLAVEAITWGLSCAHAVAAIVIRDADGGVLLSEAAPTKNLFGLNEAKEPAVMETALSEWIGGDGVATAAQLPEWKAGEEQPGGEFAFYPEPGVDQASYEALRAAKSPLFCFVQGMESQACFAMINGQLEKIGLQTFPG